MAVRLLDLQLIYGVDGAREHFEHLCARLIHSKFPDSKGVRVHQGDGGVDTFVGNWADSGGIHVFQVKFFPSGLGKVQKQQVRDSFNTCLSNQHFTTTKWTLCLPLDLSKDEIPWFNTWKQENATDTLTQDNIDYWGETELGELLLKSENRGIKEDFFKEEHLTQIREMHGMLVRLIDDIFTRLGGPPKQTVSAALMNYFQHNLILAKRILSILQQQKRPLIQFDTASWVGFIPYALSVFPTLLFTSMADTVRLLDQANKQIVDITAVYTSGMRPASDGVNFDTPSPFVIEGMNRLNTLILTQVLPKLVEVLTTLSNA